MAKRQPGSKMPSRPKAPVNGAGSDRPIRLHFVIPSDFAQSRRVQDSIFAAVAEKNWPEDDIFGLRMAMEEAMVNAIKHGNQLNPGKSVTVDATVTAAGVEVSILDQGPGFDRSSVPDPTLEENLLKPSGRGILMIESYTDRAKWTEAGRRLTLTKARQVSGSHAG